MSCDVGGVGAQENTEEGGADGVLGENEFQQLATQLRCVFDACDTSGSGFISLRQLANISRSHVSGASQVEQILDIFDAGEDGSRDDQLDFGQFHSKVLAFLDGVEGKVAESQTGLSCHNSSSSLDQRRKILDQGRNSLDQGRKSLSSNSIVGRNFEEMRSSGERRSSISNLGERRSSTSNMGERKSSFSNLSNQSSTLSPPPPVQGVFNENLRRSFDKTTSSPIRSSGTKVLKSAGRRKVSQARLTGRIPLVNTSSEEEDNCADDSFDRKIEASLEEARPLDLQPQYLVRGSVARATTKYPRKSSVTDSPQVRRNSVAHSSLVDRRRPSVTHQTPRLSSTIDGMSPILNLTSQDNFSPIAPKAINTRASMQSISSSCPSSGRGSPSEPVHGSPLDHNRKVYGVEESAPRFDSLEHTSPHTVVERRKEEEYDSPSSGVGSLKAELEDEITTSIQLARKHGEERLQAEKERCREEVVGIERQMDMERRNSALRYQQLQEERDNLKQEVDRLQEKVRLIHMEKEQLDEQVAELMEEQRCRSPVTAVSSLALTRDIGSMAGAPVTSKEAGTMAEMSSALGFNNREEELLQTVQALSLRMEEQDEQLAQVKEDNIVLRSQVRSLRETVGTKISPRPKGKEGKFRLFGMLGTGKGEPEDQAEEKYEDPADLRRMLAETRAELLDQKEVNMQLKQYVGDVLVNIIAENPNILEKQ